MNKKTFWQISYGMYIIGSQKDGKLNGQIANTVCQITSEPPAIAISICRTNLTHEYINDSRVFSVSILSKDAPMQYIGTFGFKSGRDIDKLKGTKYQIGQTGVPIALDYAVGYMEAEVINAIDVGIHTIFVGRVINTEVTDNKEPMTYAYYHDIKGGKSPTSAPTYIKETPVLTASNEQYKCSLCGYIYYPAKGDPAGSIKSSTLFKDIPDDWVCPICGADKSVFEPV